MIPTIPIKPHECDAVLPSLKAGLLPKQDTHLMQVEYKAEVSAIQQDIRRITAGDAAFRIVLGRCGSDQKKILNLARNFAFKKKLVVSHADFSTECRRYADRGEARALYNELMRNISTKTQPEGGALRTILVGWISKVQHSVFGNGGTIVDLQRQIVKDLHDLQGYPGGFEFAEVVRAYYRGFMERNETLQIAALKWLCGEYKTKTEAREDLGIRRIIDGNTFYDSLKLMAAFIKKAGYTGLLVKLDEMVVSSPGRPCSRVCIADFEINSLFR